MNEFSKVILLLQGLAIKLGLTLAIGRTLELRASDDMLVFQSSDPREISQALKDIVRAHYKLGIKPGTLY